MTEPYSLSNVMPAARPRRWPWLVLAIALAIVLVGVGYLLLRPKQLDVSGTITITGDSSSRTVNADASCTGKGGFSDLTTGAQVTVYDASGNTVGLGKLKAGRADQYSCTMAFSASAPGGGDIYSVTIGHRDRFQFRPADLPLKLSIGS